MWVLVKTNGEYLREAFWWTRDVRKAKRFLTKEFAELYRALLWNGEDYTIEYIPLNATWPER